MDDIETTEASIAADRHSHAARKSFLALGALGVVYGDIGTNPLFAMREVVHRPAPRGTDRSQRRRPALPHGLVVARGRHAEVPDAGDAGRQRRRGWAAGLVRAGGREGRRCPWPAVGVRARRAVRGGAPLRRRYGDARHLGAGRPGGDDGRRPQPGTVRHPRRHRRDRRPVPGPAPRDGDHRAGVRAGDGRVVPHSQRAGRHQPDAGAGSAEGGVARLRHPLLHRQRLPRLHRARRGGAVRRRARRRSTPIWDISGAGPSPSAGTGWSCRACCSGTSARVRCSCTIPARSTTRSSEWRRSGRSIRWSCWRRWPP